MAKQTKFVTKDFEAVLKKAGEAGFKGLKKGTTICVLDLWREAVRRAPHDTGRLDESAGKKVVVVGKTVRGMVFFGVPYAAVMHDPKKPYNLGEGSQEKQAREGIKVGPQYLTRPLKAKQKKYLKFIADAIKKEIKNGS